MTTPESRGPAPDPVDQAGPTPLTDEQQRRMRAGVPEAMLSTPYLAQLGMVFDRYEPDDVVLRLPFRPELTNDGRQYHGGVVASALDTAGAAAAWSNHDFAKGLRAATVSLAVQYVGSCSRSDLVCSARTVKRGRELTFTEITAASAEGTVVAHAMQTYRIV